MSYSLLLFMQLLLLLMLSLLQLLMLLTLFMSTFVLLLMLFRCCYMFCRYHCRCGFLCCCCSRCCHRSYGCCCSCRCCRCHSDKDVEQHLIDFRLIPKHQLRLEFLSIFRKFFLSYKKCEKIFSIDTFLFKIIC